MQRLLQETFVGKNCGDTYRQKIYEYVFMRYKEVAQGKWFMFWRCCLDNKALTNKVIELLETKREDDWWDFKQEHHDDKAKLVHDIICMANNRPRKDSYIIIGIEDNTFKILGVEEDAHRRNQQVIKDI